MRALMVPVVVLLGCPSTGATPAPPVEPPDHFCPGSPGCESVDGPFLVGAAARSIFPAGFEIARHTYLDGNADSCDPNVPADAPGRCGTLKDTMLDDCGHDGLCPGDEGYTAPDADGSQGDGAGDWWHDCGRDRLCPGGVAEADRDNEIDDDGDGAIDEGDYPGPDADGTEGDGIAQVLWIAGNSESKPVMGKGDEIWARAMVIEQGDATIAIVGLDVVGLFRDEEQRVEELVEALRPAALDRIVLSATHTHCAPDVLGQWGLVDPFAGLQLTPGRDEEHMELLRARVAEAIVAAYDAREEATLSAGQTRTGIVGLLRDGRDPQIMNDWLTAVVARAVDDDAVIATWVNWGSHPETLGNRNNFVSSDFVHTVRTSLEDGLPATSDFPAHEGLGGVAIYTTSTIGGQVGSNGFDIVGRDGTVHDPERKTYARTYALGERVAEHALRAIADATEVTGDLRFSTKGTQMPVENRVFHVGFFNGWFDRKLIRFDPNLPIDETNLPWLQTQASMIFFGDDVGVATIPGEAFSESWVGFDDPDSHADPLIRPDNENPPDLDAAPTGPAWRERMDVTTPIALGLAHDMVGYLVPPYDFELDPVSPYISEPPGDHYDETNGTGPRALPTYEAVFDALLAYEETRRP